jgi:signal transduction histidine kinase
MYDQLEDTLTSMTMQLRSAIAADARPPKAGGRTPGWARQVSAELASVLLRHARPRGDHRMACAPVPEVHRHSLRADREQHEVTMVVSDNGIGLRSETPAQGTSGIAAIRARSQAHAGFCEFAGARNAGTKVTVSVPIAAHGAMRA